MIHKYIKYVMLFVFALVQMQGYANENSERVALLTNTFTTKYAPNVYNLTSINEIGVKYDKVDYFIAEGVYFSLESEVVNGGCFSGNANTKRLRYTLKNISGNSITIVGESATSSAGKKIRLVADNVNLNSIQVIEGNLSLTGTIGYLAARTFAPNEEVIFTIAYSSDTSSTEISGGLELRYGNSTASGQMDSPDETLVEKNVILKTPNAPGNTSRTLHPQTCYSVLDAFKLDASTSQLNNIGQFRFYYNNVQISPNTLVKINSSGQIAIGTLDTNGNIVYNYGTNLPLQYSRINNTCESTRSSLTLNVDNSTKPLPGTIQQSASKVCYGGSVTFSNLTQGSANGTPTAISLNYTWEVSYNNGECWEVPTSSSLISITDTGINNENTTITFNSITQNFKVRRKYKRNFNLAGDDTLVYSYTPELSVEVVDNIISFPNDFSVYYVRLGDNITLPTPTTLYPSTVTITGPNNQPVTNNTITPTALGEYVYTYTATTVPNAQNANAAPFVCSKQAAITVVVYDATDCNLGKKRTYATHAKRWTSGLSGVANPENAVNDNNADYATITGGVVLLGIGTVGIDLYFTKPNPSNPSERILVSPSEMLGKRVTIKLGEQYSGLKLAGGLSVKGITTNRPLNNLSAAPIDAGAAFGVKGGVLDLLKGDNVFEFSFVPATSITSSGTPVGYQGIRIQLGSLLGVADLATVFRAYVEEDYTVDLTVPCEDRNPDVIVNPPSSLAYPSDQKGFLVNNTNIKLNPYVQDVTWGNYTEVLNVASGLSSVTYPYYAVDDNYNSYAIFNTTVGVLNKQFLKAKLRRQARPGDQIQLVLGTEGVNILNLGLLNLVNYKVKFFKGDQEVGSITLDRFKVLDLGLLRFEGEQRAIISAPVSGIFDYVQLEQWNTINVNLGNQLYVYDIRVNPTTMLSGQSDSKTLTDFCATDYLKLRKSDFCSDYEVSFAIATFADGQEGRPLKRLKDEYGVDLIDQYGNPMFELYDVTDISDSSLGNPFKIEDNIAYYKFTRLFSEVGNNLLIKVQTIRQGCNYGDPQYLRATLKNCDAGMINPVINSGVK